MGKLYQQWFFVTRVDTWKQVICSTCVSGRCVRGSPLTSLPECAPGSGVEDTAGIHPSKQRASHPCSWWMAAVPSTARHLLGENVQEQINPSALDNLTSKGKGNVPWPHIFLLTPLDWFEHAKWSMHKAVCQVTAFFTRVFSFWFFLEVLWGTSEHGKIHPGTGIFMHD